MRCQRNENIRHKQVPIFTGVDQRCCFSCNPRHDPTPARISWIDSNPQHMRMSLRIFNHSLVRIGIITLVIAGVLFAFFERSSLIHTGDYNRYLRRANRLIEIENSGATNATDLMVEGAWALIKDYPKYANGYDDLMIALEEYDFHGQADKSRALAEKLIACPAPEKVKLWAKGFLNRLAPPDKPIELQFTAVDGREVDLGQMRGKVVLVDFWGTHCGPCIAELPNVKAVYEKFHAQGFEVIGISCDTEKSDLEHFVERHEISWPQYFDGNQQDNNKFTIAFGISGIPHLFLVDKKGFLRFDNVSGDTLSLEEKITKLLSEK